MPVIQKDGMDEGILSKTKDILDNIHNGIDMADEIYVITVGESNRSETEYIEMQ